MRIRTAILILCLMGVSDPSHAAIEGWLEAGKDPGSFSAQRDTVVTYQGMPSARYQSTRTPTDFGTLMQCVSAEEYRGKRIRFSAMVKCQDVPVWAGLWMRIDGQGSPAPTLGFDNMQQRPIRGTADWKEYQVVLDVPASAQTICFGVLNAGAGTLWMSDVKFEPVDKKVPVTAPPAGSSASVPAKPSNLRFDK